MSCQSSPPWCTASHRALPTTVTKEVVLAMQGVRIIAGDFHKSPSARNMAGKRLNSWPTPRGNRRHNPHARGLPPLTCSSFFSEALAQRVRVTDVYMEHSSVMVDLWTKPQQRLLHAATAEVANLEQPATEWHRDFAATYKSSLNGFVDSIAHTELPRRCKGRAKWTVPDQAHPAHPEALPSWRRSHAHQSCWYCSTQWCKQFRRLQSYTHATATHPRSMNSDLYIAQLWGPITRSSGFRGGFHTWWSTRPVQLQGGPVRLTSRTASSSARCPHLPRLQDQLPKIRSLARQQAEAGH